MGYVGNPQAGAFSSKPAKQDLTGASGTSLTLSNAVANAESISLFINNVRQEPTTAYSVSGTAVTLTGSVAASDDIYVIYNSLALQEVVPPDGSVGTAKLADSSVTAAKLAAGVQGVAGITTASTSGTAMSIDSSNRITTPARPSFHAYGTTASWTVFSNGSWTKLVLPATGLNIGTYYDTTNSKFVAPIAGVYAFYYKIYGRIQSGGAASTYWQSRFQKNNSAITGYSNLIIGYNYNTGGYDETATYSMTISLAASDEITVHATAAGAQNGEYYPPNCEFGGHLIG